MRCLSKIQYSQEDLLHIFFMFLIVVVPKGNYFLGNLRKQDSLKNF